MMLEDASPCELTCEKQWATGTAKCKAKRTALAYGWYSYGVTAVDSADLTRKTNEACKAEQDPVRDKCKAACTPASKPAETPAGTGSADSCHPCCSKTPAETATTDSKPPETPADTGSADTKPPAATTDSADHKPPVETDAAEGKPNADPK
jgi:hypothetical protein